MTIRNRMRFMNSVWDWGPLAPCFPRQIEPTDIDGWVEIGGYFLVLEGKDTGVDVPAGQLTNFRNMARWNETVPGLFTIIVLWGNPRIGQIDYLQFWPAEPISGDWDTLRSYIKAWAECAEERAAKRDKHDLTAVG